MPSGDCLLHRSTDAESARNDSANGTLRTATRSYRHTAYRETNPPLLRRNIRRAAGLHHARRRRVVQSTYCSEPSAILRSWRRVSSNFLENEFSASHRRNARHYKMCFGKVVDKAAKPLLPSTCAGSLAPPFFSKHLTAIATIVRDRTGNAANRPRGPISRRVRSRCA